MHTSGELNLRKYPSRVDNNCTLDTYQVLAGSCKGCVGGVSGHMTPTQLLFEHNPAQISARARV